MPNISDFNPHTLNELADSFAKELPKGRIWESAHNAGTNMRNVLRGLATEMQRFESFLDYLVKSYIPNLDNSLIVEWEKDLGIPDDCFSITNVSDAKRRRNILIKLAYMNLQTEQDYLALAAIMGLNIEIVPGDPTLAVFPFTFPFVFQTPQSAANTWKIIIKDVNIDGFTYTFPVTFEDDNDVDLFKCIVEKQKPAYTKVIFEVEN